MSSPTVRTFRIDLGYDGTDFFGSQRQPGVRTVQGVLEAAASRLVGTPVRMTLAGRTDRGVHAVGQVASVKLPWRRSTEELSRALEALTPDDVTVYRVSEEDAEFHARYSARYREYRFRIWEGPRAPVLLRRYVWAVRTALDMMAMQTAADSLIGRRDFAAVAGGGLGVPGGSVNTVRTLRRAEWREVSQPIEPIAQGGRLLEFVIGADGFLPHMVRNIVGVLVAIGRGDQPATYMETLLAGRDRRLAGAPAPPQGLVLWRVAYGENPDGVAKHADAVGNMGVEGDEDILTKGC